MNTPSLFRSFFIFCVALGAASPLALAAPTRYEIDGAHSAVTFKIRHLVTQVPGTFKKVSGSFDYDPKDPKKNKAEVEIDADSIDTGNEKRDEHLKTADFLDVEKYPTLKFVAKEFKGKGEKAKLVGDLTLHGVTKPVTLDLEVGGETKDPQGKMRAGFNGTTKISRKDFGLTWNKALEAGKLLVGDEVTIGIAIEGVAANEPAKKD